jgi:flagellin
MALGVLNNLSAIYAENNLNNTNSSLQTVLQQLSSGSKINSGADDAAGLSLVNGLEANQTALTQSETNATEGVGLLQVADGALSQVTSLLDRAITLATEASNGTLNTTQEGAANQEYQSILSEVNNIGQTTTYNQEQVFDGQKVAIYTGDSSAAGSSIDDLNIRTLSESSVGDTGGKMAYSSGANSVFVNLSTSSTNAKATDILNTNGATTIDVNYLVKGGDGTATTASTSITVGTNTSYSNTVEGLISAINNAGLGLSANFSTQAQAGVVGGGAETGIQITGGLISAGLDPGTASTSGTLDPNGIPASELLTQGQKVSISVGGTNEIVVPINSSINTLSELENAINTGVGATTYTGGLVTASVITNGDGTQSLSLAVAPGEGALSVTTTSGTGAQAPAFVSADTVNGINATTLGTATTTAYGLTQAVATNGSVTFGSAGTNAKTDALTLGTSIVLTNSIPNDPTTMTFVVGNGTDTATTFFTANHAGADGTSLQLGGLMDTINAETTTNTFTALAGLGASATFSAASGLTVSATIAQNGEGVTIGPNTLSNANNGLSLVQPTLGGAAVNGTNTVTILDDTGGGALSSDSVLKTGTQLQLTNALGSMNFTAAAGQTFADLALAIDNSTLGVNAVWSATAGAGGQTGGGLVLTSKTPGTPAANAITVGTDTLADHTNTDAVINVDAGATAKSAGTAATAGSASTAIIELTSMANMNDATVNLTGRFTLNFNGNSQVFVMGTDPGGGSPQHVAGAVYTGANTVSSLLTAVNGTLGSLGVSATAPDLAGGINTGAIYLQGNIDGNFPITMTASTLAATSSVAQVGSATPGVTGEAAIDAVTTLGGTAGTTVNTNDALGSSTITVQNTTSGTAQTFVIGSTGSANHTTYLTSGTTLSQLATSITNAGLGITAQANTAGITLTQNAGLGDGTIVPSSDAASQIIVTGSLTDTTKGAPATAEIGGFASANDTVSGTLNFTINTSPTPTTEAITLNAGETVAQMVTQINNGTGAPNSHPYGVTASLVTGSNGFESILLTSNTLGTTGNITPSALTNITDTTTTAALSYTATSPYDIGISNTKLSAALYDSTTGQSQASFVANSSGSSQIATISYSDGAGEALNSTDLTNQTDAETALNTLNIAITDVAAQDGYIGAQINTLNSISQVMSTQQENVVSAQNAIQATDYASATANMSKYEILSQTGIAALAQANSVQQEVTKLLQ